VITGISSSFSWFTRTGEKLYFSRDQVIENRDKVARENSQFNRLPKQETKIMDK